MWHMASPMHPKRAQHIHLFITFRVFSAYSVNSTMVPVVMYSTLVHRM